MQAKYTKEELYEQLFDLREQREGLLSEQEKHDCDDNLAIRVRQFGKGTHYVNQCQKCGRQRGNAKGRIEAIELNGGVEPPRFDESIEENYIENYKLFAEVFNNLHAEERRIEELIYEVPPERGYASFKQQLEHEQKRLDDASSRLTNFLAELEADFGKEKLNTLLAKQIASRKQNHYSELLKTTERFTDENELKVWFKKWLNRDFIIYEEVWGTHLAENVNVRIDFILYPKPHLIDEGFIKEPFGIEVKYFKQESGFTHKTSRGIWQTISYNDCMFHIKGRDFKTKFCLLFSNLSFPAETALIQSSGFDMDNDPVEWRGMLHVANHARVGILSISGNKDSMKGWSMKFAGGTYFYSSSPKNEISYHLSNPDTVNKMRIGNF